MSKYVRIPRKEVNLTVLDKTIVIMRSFVENPYTNLIIGMILFGSGLSEAWNTLHNDIVHMNIKVHHGVMIFGIFSMLKTLPDIFLSLEHVHRGIGK
jgi:hypothetical protein